MSTRLAYTIILLSIALILSPLVNSQEIELSNPYSFNLYPYIPAMNVTINASVNNSLYALNWLTADRGALSRVDDINHNWLSNLAWSVAGHIIDTDLDMNNNDIVDLRNVEGVNATFEYVNVTEDLYVSNSTLVIGGVAISESNNILQIEEGALLNATALAGDGSRIFNLSLNYSNGTAIFGNISAENFFGGNYFGDSYSLNGTSISDWSEVNYTVGNGTVFYSTPSFSGSYSVVLPETFNFEIAQIIVEPDTNARYSFSMYETGSGETIDADIMRHRGTWNIFKSFPIDSQVSLNFTNVVGTNQFNVTIKYFTNVQG